MKKIFKNYKSLITLLSAIIIGGILGVIFKEKITFLKPFGDLFLNLLLMIITPLIFLTLTTSIGKMKEPKRIGKILLTTIIIFIITSLISVSIGIISTNNIKLVNNKNGEYIKESLIKEETTESIESTNYLEKTINTISVNDFSKLLTKENMIALILFSILFGISLNLSKEKGKKLLEVLDSTNEVLQKLIKLIMYYAPIGLGCYFAALVGTYGTEIALGYGKTFIIYLVVSIFTYLIVYSIYAYIAYGKQGFKNYWKSILPATITALSTCSSAASIPVNVECAKKAGASEDIANTVIPLGTNFHKDGSIIGSVFKIMFLINLFNMNIPFIKILSVSLLATLLVTAVPIGGGTISEMLIITLLGFPIYSLPILTIIATIIDAPATVLNVVGDTASSMLVTRIIDKKEKYLH